MRTSSRAIGALFLACCLTSLAQGETGIRWQTDLEAAKRLAASSNRLVLIHFSASWCQPCKQLESQVLSKDSVAQVIEPNYVPVKLDVDRHGSVARQYGVKGVPWDVVITPDGQVLDDFNSPQGSSAYVAAMTGIAAKYRPQAPTMVASLGAAPQATAVPAAYGAPAPAAQGTTAATQPPAQAAAPQQNRYSDNRYADYYNQRQQPVADRVSPPIANQAGVGPQFGPQGAQQTGPSFAPPAGNPQAPPAYQPQNAIPQMSVSPDALHSSQPGLSANPPATSGIGAQAYGAAPTPNHQAAPAYSPPAGNMAPPAMNSPAGATNTASPAFALDGYCPVHLMEQGNWTKGDPAYGAIHRGKTYLFTSQQCQQRFLANPERYAPAFDGNDPVLLIDRNQTVPGRRDIGCYLGVEPNRRIVLFADETSYQAFANNPQRYAAQAFAPQK